MNFTTKPAALASPTVGVGAMRPAYGGPPRESQQAGLYVCAAVTWVVGGCFVALRFYTRRAVLRVLGAADWCILAAWMFAAGVMVSAIDQVYRGQGKHIWDTGPDDLAPGIRASWYGIFFYSLTVCFVKISILLLYFAFFTIGWAWWTARITMGFVIISNVWTLGSVLAACVPLEAYWDINARNGAFCQAEQVWFFNNGLHVATDFFIFALPLPVVWSLRIPWRQKLAIMGLFALGFFVCILALVRLVLLVNTARTIESDFTWNASSITYWTCVEVNLAIACACAVTLKPLIVRCFPRIFASDQGSSARARAAADAFSAPATVGTRKTRDYGDAPRIDSWIGFPGKIDGFYFSEKEISGGNPRRHSIVPSGSGEQPHPGFGGERASRIGIAVSDWESAGGLEPKYNEYTAWKEAHRVGGPGKDAV